ncbi:hypothetical protein GEMRC1_007578 [Eukaryota sp. GEM-RC1]
MPSSSSPEGTPCSMNGSLLSPLVSPSQCSSIPTPFSSLPDNIHDCHILLQRLLLKLSASETSSQQRSSNELLSDMKQQLYHDIISSQDNVIQELLQNISDIKSTNKTEQLELRNHDLEGQIADLKQRLARAIDFLVELKTEITKKNRYINQLQHQIGIS